MIISMIKIMMIIITTTTIIMIIINNKINALVMHTKSKNY